MYQRVVQWLAQPIASGVSIGAAVLFHQNVSHNAAENVAVIVATQVVGLIVHASWFRNVSKWWDHVGTAYDQAPEPVAGSQDGWQTPVLESSRKPDPPTTSVLQPLPHPEDE